MDKIKEFQKLVKRKKELSEALYFILMYNENGQECSLLKLNALGISLPSGKDADEYLEEIKYQYQIELDEVEGEIKEFPLYENEIFHFVEKEVLSKCPSEYDDYELNFETIKAIIQYK